MGYFMNRLLYFFLFSLFSSSSYASYFYTHESTGKMFSSASSVESFHKSHYNNTFTQGGDLLTDCWIVNPGGHITGKCKANGQSVNVAMYLLTWGSPCSSGEELVDGECRPTPPTCPDGEDYNPETGQCEPPPEPPFCSRESTQQEMAAFQAQCMADGGTSTIVCNDNVSPPDFRMSCDIPPPPPEGCEPGSPSWPQCLEDENKCDENHPDWNPEYGMCCNAENDYCDVPPPESCTIFSPNWPECAGDTDIDPPTGGDLTDPDKPDGGGAGNPEPDKPEPEVDDKPDANQAIKAMNEDMNKQLTSISNDMNKNHAESKSALDALKASMDLNTDTTVDAANHLQDTLERQGQADAALGNKTNQLLTSANNLLNGGFASISNGLDDLQGANQAGFGEVVGAVEGLGEKLDGLGEIYPTGGVGATPLYTSESYAALLSDVANLKDEYKSILNDFKHYFNFNSGVNSGDFNSHNLGLNWQGHEINKENQVLKTLRDNAGIISAVVIFMFGVAGIRVLVGAL